MVVFAVGKETDYYYLIILTKQATINIKTFTEIHGVCRYQFSCGL